MGYDKGFGLKVVFGPENNCQKDFADKERVATFAPRCERKAAAEVL